jgi:hypothetical protein
MKMTVEPTEKIVELNGVPARIWEGATDDGIPCHLFVTRVAVPVDRPASEHAKFAAALRETRPPSPEVSMYPLRLVL